MATQFKIYSNVNLGEGSVIEDFCIVGKPLKDKEDLKTIIGKNALIRSHSIIYAVNKIGNNFQTGHSILIREENEIGNDVSIGTMSVVEHHVKIGDNVRIHSQAFIPEFCILEKNCWIGPNVVLTNTLHPRCSKAKDCLKKTPVTIKENAKIGANATILPGVTIGKNSVVGAGSVVTENIPDNKVVAGNPARIIGDIENLKCKTGLKDKPY